MEHEESHYVGALGEAARLLKAPGDVDETLGGIIGIALSTVGCFDHAGVVRRLDDGRLEARAAGDVVRRLAVAESVDGAGPCLAAMADDAPVAVQSLGHDGRWPAYVEAAVAEGVRSQLVIPLDLEPGDGSGGLVLCSTSTDTVSDEAIDVATSFATLAGLALTQRHAISGLEEALRSRKTIGMAVGLLMERLGIDEERAFAYLVRESSSTNTKLRDVALRIVDSANAPDAAPVNGAAARPVPRPAPPADPGDHGRDLRERRVGS